MQPALAPELPFDAPLRPESDSCHQLATGHWPLFQRSLHHFYSRRRREAEARVWYFDVLLLLKKAEFRDRAVHFLDDDTFDIAGGIDLEQSSGYPLAQAVRNTF